MDKKPYEIYIIASEDYWYVGSASGKTTATKRFTAHLKGKGRAYLLWGAIQKLGASSFTQKILEKGVGNPVEAEQKWYDWYLANDSRNTLNGRRPGAWDGHIHSAIELEKMRQAQIGRRHTLESREKMSAWQIGRTPPNKGVPHTIEARIKMSQAHVGRPAPSLSTRKKMSAAQIGRTHSEETKTKMRIAQLGMTKKICKNNTSGYKGVHFDKRVGKWCARIQINGIRNSLGYFDDPFEAHIAVEAAR